MRTLHATVVVACVALAGLITVPTAGMGQEKPAPARTPYELRLMGIGDTYQGIRFKPATGESWQIVGRQWVKLPEMGPVPPGDYDVILVPRGEDLVALRIDRPTGATWLLKARRWTEIKEGPVGGVPEALPGKRPRGGYELRHVLIDDRLQVLRFNARTGAAEYINGDTYEAQAETGPVPPGDYDVQMVAGGGKWMAFRMDRATGVTWVLKNNKWHKAAEPD